MDFLATPQRRKFLFATLYFSEGAPIGVPLEAITKFAAVLVVPWTFKFAWAPLVDLLRSRFWTLKHWIIAAQAVMTATLAPLLLLDLQDDFSLIVALLVVHAVAAATQDVAIDALCISVTQPLERGAYNGWMQAGMLLGRSLLGGGALVLAAQFGEEFAIGLLMTCVAFSAILLGMSRIPHETKDGEQAEGNEPRHRSRLATVVAESLAALKERSTWLGLAFALTGGAAFKALEVVIGPFLLDRGFDTSEIGWFTAIPMIGAMIGGSLVGGRLADRLHRRRAVQFALLWIVTAVASLAGCDVWTGFRGSPLLLVLLVATAFGIGLFTAASYALFMDLTRPRIAGTQFSAFMGATNGCEAWSVLVFGEIVAAWNYPSAMLSMCLASLLAIGLVAQMKLGAKVEPTG
jgi:MFS family permease